MASPLGSNNHFSSLSHVFIRAPIPTQIQVEEAASPHIYRASNSDTVKPQPALTGPRYPQHGAQSRRPIRPANARHRRHREETSIQCSSEREFDEKEISSGACFDKVLQGTLNHITLHINTTASLTHPRPRTPSTKPVDAIGLESKNARTSEHGIAYTNNAHATNVSDARVRSPRRGADGDICFSRAGAGRERMSRRGQNALCTVCMNGLTCQRICRRLARTAHDANGRERIRGREGE
jgi:hypothetical protein